jgi:transposase
MAWVIKESFREYYRETNRSIAEERLRLMVERIANDSLAKFRELLRILSNWRAEILNYFGCRIINGFVEGKNNWIKTIKRTAYGYRNLANFRLKILANDPSCEIAALYLLTWSLNISTLSPLML